MGAQFEREVTAERIRDKLAASKARGMWMSGTPPLGYEPHGRSLAIVEKHADLVRTIFQLYLDLGTVRGVCDELDRRGIVKPIRTSKGGTEYGGHAFVRGEIYAMLANPIYIGRIRHKQTLHPGLHPAIIDLPVWDAVQKQLQDHRNGEHHIRSASHRSLLAGKLFDDEGQPLVASHASKGAQRYRYYVSRDLQLGDKDTKAKGMRIPAAEIEKLVCGRLAKRLDDPVALIEQINAGHPLPDSISNIMAICRTTASLLRGSDLKPSPV